MNLPKWAWWIIGAVIVMIIVVVLKVDINIGSHGFSITQGLVH